MSKTKHVVAMVAGLWLAGCGKNQVGTQADQRSTFTPELRGAWLSHCENKAIHKITIEDGKMAFEKVTYFDPECQERDQTVRQSATSALSTNFKDGVNNSIVLVPSNDVLVTLHSDFDSDNQNNILTRINNEKEAEIRPEMSPAQKKQTARENLKIRAAKELKPWKRDEEKTLNRLQLEKLATNGLASRTIAEQLSQISVRYEVDNGFLQITGPGDYARVYSKQP